MGSFSILSGAKELIIPSVKFSGLASKESDGASKENLTTDEIINSFATERIEKEPILYNFMAIPKKKKNQLQVNRENVFATKTRKRFQKNYSIMVLASPKRGKQLKTWVISLSSTAL